MSERMSERISDNMPARMSEDLRERMSEDMSERMSGDTSERMSEDMSGRMAEHLSERMLGQEEEVGCHVSSIDSIAAIESEVFEAHCYSSPAAPSSSSAGPAPEAEPPSSRSVGPRVHTTPKTLKDIEPNWMFHCRVNKNDHRCQVAMDKKAEKHEAWIDVYAQKSTSVQAFKHTEGSGRVSQLDVDQLGAGRKD